MDDFKTVRLKKKTLSRFKTFSRKVGSSYSNTLEMVMNFFEWHGFLPSERFEKSVGQELVRNRKRTEAVIAIIKDIEKSQTKPTTAMLLKLFEEASQEEEEEDYDFGPPTLMTENEVLSHYQEGYYKWQKNYQSIKNEMDRLLARRQYVKNTFGRGSLKLEMTQKELEALKQRLNNINQNRTS